MSNEKNLIKELKKTYLEHVNDSELSGIHDVIVDICDLEPSRKAIEHLINKLPTDVFGKMISWGARDTEVRESVWEYVEEHQESLTPEFISLGSK